MSTQSPKISIIVPVYKVEQYLPKCIDSILAQTYQDWELLLIDDGSPDNSGKICDEYAQKDRRLRVFHTENKGVNKARSMGVEQAIGEWINFVDSDDTIPQKSLELLISRESENTDIIVGFLSKVLYTQKQMSIHNYRSCLITGKVFSCGPTAKLYRKNLFCKDVFDIPRDIVNGEDMLMNIRLSFRTDKTVQIVPHIVYTYVKNPSSCTRTFMNSTDYEDFFHKYRLVSIPEKYIAQYQKEMIERRLYSLKGIIYHNRDDYQWRNSSFYKKLECDIQKNKYKVPLITYLLLRVNNRLLIFILYAIDKFLRSQK